MRLSPNEAPVLFVSGNNIYGNGDAAADGDKVNCGIENPLKTPLPPQTLNYANNFWGSATGPGANPSDQYCQSGNVNVPVTPFAATEF